MASNDNQSASPFTIGTVVGDPAKFWGRQRECQAIITRLRKMESTSIVGARRIGKTSLASYIYKVCSNQLGESYEFIWLDAQSAHSTSVDDFFKVIAQNSSLAYESAGENLKGCLQIFEGTVIAHPKKLALFINEFEILTDGAHQAEFGIDFYNTLRMLAEQGHCAIIMTSYTSLKVTVKNLIV